MHGDMETLLSVQFHYKPIIGLNKKFVNFILPNESLTCISIISMFMLHFYQFAYVCYTSQKSHSSTQLRK